MARPPVHSDPAPAEPGGGGAGGKKPDRRHQVTLVAIGMAIVLLVWFALANVRNVRIDFWVVDREAPLILVIVISGLLGALITALLMRRRAKADKGG